MPRILLDPRVKELDPSEHYYEETLDAIADNPQLSFEKARQWMEAFA